MFNQRGKQTGLGLIELMISLVLASALIITTYKIYSSYMQTGLQSLRTNHMQLVLEQAMSEMNREFRRAVPDIDSDDSFEWDTDTILKINNSDGSGNVITPGNPGNFPSVLENSIGPILGVGPAFGNGRVQITDYNGSGASATGITLTPFTNMSNDGKLQPGEWFVVNPMVTTISSVFRLLTPGPDAGSCALFTYDADKDGDINVLSNNDERYGYRLTTENDIGVLEKRQGGDFTDCTSGTWQAITDNKLVNITDLNFSLNSLPSGNSWGGCNYQQSLTITLTGQRIDDATVSKTLTQTAPIKNVQISTESC
jgi:type II secretory pathway component PulJ